MRALRLKLCCAAQIDAYERPSWGDQHGRGPAAAAGCGGAAEAAAAARQSTTPTAELNCAAARIVRAKGHIQSLFQQLEAGPAAGAAAAGAAAAGAAAAGAAARDSAAGVAAAGVAKVMLVVELNERLGTKHDSTQAAALELKPTDLFRGRAGQITAGTAADHSSDDESGGDSAPAEQYEIQAITAARTCPAKVRPHAAAGPWLVVRARDQAAAGYAPVSQPLCQLGWLGIDVGQSPPHRTVLGRTAGLSAKSTG